MNKFSSNLKKAIISPDIKDKFFIWLLELMYPDTSIIKDVEVIDAKIVRAKNLLPIGNVKITTKLLTLNPKS